MEPMFCCSEITPFRPQRLDHELKFTAFLEWARSQKAETTDTASDAVKTAWDLDTTYTIQLVRQVNYGPVEFKRYFLSIEGLPSSFKEVTEQDLVAANYKKLNSFKNFRCSTHNKFFELNVYKKDPVNKHHWRANIARPGADIDL